MRSTWLTPFILLLACNGPDADDSAAIDDTAVADTGGPGDLPESYAFTTRDADSSSVSYSGQVARQVLIHDLDSHMGGLTARIDGGWFPTEGEVEGELNFYFEFDSSTAGTLEHDLSFDLPTAQSTYDDISTGKDLVGKLAGNDPVGQHEDWSTDFAGWDADSVTTPESLVRHWFGVIDDQAVDWAAGTYPLGPDGTPVPSVYVTPEGQDLQELTAKFLLGAINFSQAADDYLDDDTEGKGLMSDHSEVSGDKAYTELEHAWDEGFGYFGASRSYGSWTDEQIIGEAVDIDEDGSIDLMSEVCFGASVNAAKRDAGASSDAATDFTSEAWSGFLEGRHLIATADGALTDDQMTDLQGHRDQAVEAWEKAMAATAVHYINDTLQDMSAFGTDDYSFADHAGHWSELKGFALSFQFNPRSPMSDEDFTTLHGYLGTAPVLPNAPTSEIEAYESDLLAARTLIGEAYGFDANNLGDDDGLDGW